VLLPDCFELTVTSVSRPTTAEGLTTNRLPLPLLDFIPATAVPMHSPDCGTHVLTPLESIVQLDWHWYPPLMAPLDERVHPVKLLPVVEYEKLPLLCALARAGVSTTIAKIKHNFFMLRSSLWYRLRHFEY
jgi:hypothetical protein